MKRHKALIALSSDHHHGLAAAKKLKNLVYLSSTELVNVIDEFKSFYNSKLLGHFRDEEEILAPYFNEDPLVKRMLSEHIKMNNMFGSLSEGNNLIQNIYSLGELLEAHIRFEEHELFPMIEKSLSENILEEIGRKIKQRRST